MKKLNFMNVKEEDILTRGEMRSVMAGSGGSSCYQACDDATSTCLQDCIDSHPHRGSGSGYAQCVNACEEQTEDCFEECGVKY
jgi:hypothetical protein